MKTIKSYSNKHFRSKVWNTKTNFNEIFNICSFFFFVSMVEPCWKSLRAKVCSHYDRIQSSTSSLTYLEDILLINIMQYDVATKWQRRLDIIFKEVPVTTLGEINVAIFTLLVKATSSWRLWVQLNLIYHVINYYLNKHFLF